VGPELNVLALLKGAERYIYVYDDGSHQDLLEALHEQAANNELSLNGFDAAVLSQKSREQVQLPATPPSRF
jgi:hypothetical protein